ncbi:MAG: branched-chain amino acid ABC transporter permease, partial [Pseudaminobacter sp.]
TTDAFAVVVIGGLGSIGGAAIASVLIGLVKSFGIVVLPQLSVTLVFILMVIVLLLRPNGLMGERE